MRRLLFVLFVAVLLLVLLFVPVAFAGHNAGPCNDSDGDGSFSGREFAEHHVTALAQGGDVGAVDHDGDGMQHTPGSHRGFSACNPSGN
jgi:hypothetical protein